MLFQAVIERKRYHFLIGTGPGEYEALRHMRPGQEMRLAVAKGALTIDEMPVQRLYRKTMEGIVEIADSAWNLLRTKAVFPGGRMTVPAADAMTRDERRLACEIGLILRRLRRTRGLTQKASCNRLLGVWRSPILVNRTG